MKAVTPIPFVRAKFTDKCGKPLAGGKVYTYEANTTTLKATYKDPYGLTENTNPIVLDSAGEADIYLHGTYRIRIMSRNNVIINDVDKIGSWYSSGLQDTLNNISNGMNEQLKPLLDAAAALGAGANGWITDIVATNIKDASTQDLFNQKGVTTVNSTDELNTLDKWSGRTVNVQNVGVFSFDASSNTWQQLSQKAKIGFDIEDWLKNTIITPDLFLKQAGGDDLKAFYLACDKANSLNLPVTLLPRTYELSDSIDLRKASCGITTSSERFSATTLKAIANTSNASTFVNYQNMDRTKLCSFRVDANSLYDIGIDSSYTLQVGPSLNITFETIWVKGYNKIGWLAENNSDVYFKSCAVFEPGTKSDKTVISIRCVTIGGPAQFECCNFLGGKQQVAAQHITNIMCVLSGIEFLKGSWNNYSAVGTHHFADLATNSCFTITGELWGFDVSGGLCEASDDGYLFSGNGGNTVTGKLQFNGTKITPNTGKMYLDRGTLGLKYGNLIASFNGGMQGLTGLDSLKIFDDVSLNSTNNTVSAISKDVVMSASAYRNYRTERSNLFSRTYTQRNDSSLVNVSPIYGTLSSNGGYYGVIDILSNKVAAGILNVISDDKRKSAQYRINNLLDANGNVVFNIVEVSNLSTTSNKFTVYYADNNLHVILSRDFPDDKTIKNVDYSFSGFITNT